MTRRRKARSLETIAFEHDLDDLREARDDIRERSPLDYPWGYFSYSPSPYTIAFGESEEYAVGSLQWFPTAEDMVDFFINKELRSCWPRGVLESEWQAITSRLPTILLRPAKAEFGRELRLFEANELLEHTRNLDWWGTFAELCRLPEARASRWREYFREDMYDDCSARSARPIKARQRGEFAHYLRRFSI